MDGWIDLVRAAGDVVYLAAAIITLAVYLAEHRGRGGGNH
jgi:hypothetical protein